jgi:hypothetical protein
MGRGVGGAVGGFSHQYQDIRIRGKVRGESSEASRRCSRKKAI